ncbi:hypothetical protein ACOSP7_006566 [Xanthoceras sorbifolium]
MRDSGHWGWAVARWALGRCGRWALVRLALGELSRSRSWTQGASWASGVSKRAGDEAWCSGGRKVVFVRARRGALEGEK